MRTLLFILGGFALLALFLGAARLMASTPSAAMRSAAWLFIAVWFLVAAANMWIGVTRAGYSVMEELPIFLLIFGAPAVVAAILRWKF